MPERPRAASRGTLKELLLKTHVMMMRLSIVRSMRIITLRMNDEDTSSIKQPPPSPILTITLTLTTLTTILTTITTILTIIIAMFILSS
mmetsp:Transcript_15857/g.39860  ORF Transcript_15857/g.39860 Transcript_15857/m.39860 type:complete len:89 (+) Transcript_15857:961-1227(+)